MSTDLRKYSAPALDKGLDILEHLADAKVPVSQLDISRALGRTSGEIYRMLMCLEERGYVARDEGTGKFRLTLRLYELSHRQNPTSMLRKAARVPMEVLADTVGQACHLSVMKGPELFVLMERMPSCRISLAVGEGSRYPVLQTTSGKLLLSRWPEQDVLEYFQQLPGFSETSTAEQWSVLGMIESLRHQTHHHAPSETADGVSDISVPIGSPGSDVSGALVISYLSASESNRAEVDRYLDALLAGAAEINRNLGIVI